MRRTNQGSAYIRKQQLVNRLARIGYRFVDAGDRVEMYRRPNGAHYVAIPRTKLVAVETARSILRQAGLDEDQIGDFLKSAQA
ncbi:MAG TPA: type II toxin-antitoxin system HicA family toxin [Candidatus Eisenbacteria bacterium]|nr:type II toxin-antitoxin system HicA family toxin [Candidatus Eisenbacteria bacterium]